MKARFRFGVAGFGTRSLEPNGAPRPMKMGTNGVMGQFQTLLLSSCEKCCPSIGGRRWRNTGQPFLNRALKRGLHVFAGQAG
jgi:hypothetical protein